MTPAELRRRQILRMLDLDGAVRVTSLARSFGVSEVTIRSDLATLDRQGRLTRVHGGGLKRGGDVAEGFDHHLRRQDRPRRWIAERAAALVENGDTIFLDGSPTGLLIAQRLHDRRALTVVTNSTFVGRAAADGGGTTVVLLGGVLRAGASATIPDPDLAGGGRLQIGRAFVAPDAISFEDGLLLDNADIARSLRKVFDASAEVIALVDATAFARLGTAAVAGLDRVARLFVDEYVAPEHLARLRERRIPVTLCGEHRSTHLTAVEPRGRRWRIGFANTSEEVEFAVTVRRSIERAAAASGVVDLVLADNDIDGPTALRNVERFVEAGVHLVVEYLHLAQYGEVIMSRLRAAGVPAISINAPMAGARYFGVDNYLVGRLGGEAAGRAAAARWGREIDRVIVVSLTQASENTLARVYGQLEALRECVDVPDDRVLHVAIRPLRAEARAAVGDVLAASPDDRRIVVLNTNDEAALGAADALRGAGRAEHAVVVGQGGDTDGRLAIADPASPIVATVAYHPERYGEQVVGYAIDILEGRPAPPAIVLEAELLERSP